MNVSLSSQAIELAAVVCCLAIALLFALRHAHRAMQRFRASAAPGAAGSPSRACGGGCDGCAAECPSVPPNSDDKER